MLRRLLLPCTTRMRSYCFANCCSLIFMFWLFYAVLALSFGSVQSSLQFTDQCPCTVTGSVPCVEWPPQMFSPDHQCPIWLKGVGQSGGPGFGHRFMCFNHMLTVAAQFNLTLHGTWGSDEIFGPLVHREVPAECTEEVIANWDALPDAVARHRAECDKLRPPPPRCVVLRVETPFTPVELGLNHVMLRRLYTLPETVQARAFVHAWQPDNMPDRSRLTVSVHIRRGDVLDAAWYTRQVPNRAFINVLHDLLPVLKPFAQGSPIHVVLHVQGTDTPTNVPDMIMDAGEEPNNNFEKMLHMHEVDVTIGTTGDLDTFAQMCEADVLITSKSGFSHSAGTVCERPVILAVPMWHSYLCYPNALTMHEVGTGCKMRYHFKQDNFVELFKRHSAWIRERT